ncbi:SMI1/KNR4 family protein [Lacticaseibacillus zeae]|uniref:SMI1/KNR4 family protein n=1 Tax=Lacticaseibacillus zeae TaxID=57037 RepID=UPI000B8B57D7|nr:SMI1/KNR4 family protein [Lacticaseibacillus zeae]
MLPWPNKIPQPNLPTIPHTDLIPSTYFSTIKTGCLPKRWWLPTSEPTSDGLDGVGIHAFATPGAAITADDLPADFLPFAHTGHQYFGFDLSHDPRRIRYIDTEVDQWLTVAPDFDTFLKQLQPHPVRLPELPVEPQVFGHMAVIATADDWPALFDHARTFMTGAEIGPWLIWLATSAASAKRQAAAEEYHFLSRYQPNFLTPNTTIELRKLLS